jgi:hypothetical protein
MSLTQNKPSNENTALRQINEVWHLHDAEKLPEASAGCLAFVVDRRAVDEHGIEFRLAVSFGENPFPPGKPKGFLTPHPMPGKHCFGVHIVGTRGGRMALFDQWYDAREADGLESPGQSEGPARAILAAISDEDYAGHVSPDLHAPLPVTVSELLPLDDYEMVHDEWL